MVDPRQIDFSEGTTPSPPSLSRRKSPRKHASKSSHKKKKLASAVSNRIWNEEDELTVLNGLVDYQAQRGLEPNNDWDDFYRFLGDSIVEKFSKDQLLSKIRKLKGKFLVRMEKISPGNDPIFAGINDAEAFRLSRRIWGQNDSESANQNKTGEETCKENEQMCNHVPLNENVVAEAGFEGNDTDESCALRDAFETVMSRGLTDYQKKSQLEKLMNLGKAKRKELSDEWKALCAEELKLNAKRFRFSAMLAEATDDE